MSYKITYRNKDKEEVELLDSNRESVRLAAEVKFLEKGRQGELIVEYRRSSYYGDYQHIFTLGMSKDKRVIGEEPVFFYPKSENKHCNSELDPFKQYRLEQEPRVIKRFIWMLRSKAVMMKGSEIRIEYNRKIEEYIQEFKKNFNIEFSELADYARNYECWNELVTD